MNKKSENNKQAIIVLHEIYGVNQFIKEQCQKFTEASYDVFCPNLIDRGFITFKDDGEVIVSNRIVGDVPRLNISDRILCNLSYGNMEYLEWHRDEIFEV